MAIDLSLDRSRLIHNHPFFGALAMYLNLTEDPNCGTAWCDGENIGYDPKFWERLNEAGRQFVLAHEVMHAALRHCGTIRMGIRHSAIWNRAGDHVINLLLTQSKMAMPTGEDAGLLDPKYKNWETERVYADIEKNSCPLCGSEKGKGKPGKQGKKGGGCCPKCGAPVVLCPGDVRQGTSEQAQKDDKADVWTERLVQAAQIAKQMGKLPGCIEEMIKLILYPKLPWWQILHRLVDKNFPDDFCWTVPDRRMLGYDIWVPGLESPRGKVVIALDTSGSMSTQELAEGLAEARAVFASKKIYQVRIIQCDAAIHMDTIVENEDDVPIKIHGRGGTSFNPVFHLLEEDPPKALIYFTDLEGEFPKKHPEYLVWWVSSQKGKKPPFGEHLVLNGGCTDDEREAHAEAIQEEI